MISQLAIGTSLEADTVVACAETKPNSISQAFPAKKKKTDYIF